MLLFSHFMLCTYPPPSGDSGVPREKECDAHSFPFPIFLQLFLQLLPGMPCYRLFLSSPPAVLSPHIPPSLPPSLSLPYPPHFQSRSWMTTRQSLVWYYSSATIYKSHKCHYQWLPILTLLPHITTSTSLHQGFPR